MPGPLLRPNPVKAALRAGRPQLGTFAKLADPAAVEILALAGFNFIIIDREHTQFGDETMVNLIRAADAHGLTPTVRVRELNAAAILHALDAGALGVQVPQVNSPVHARAVIDAVKYPPVGRRGYAATQRSAAYGFADAAAYAAHANTESLVVVYCETKEAVEALDDILALPEIDVVFLGPADLSASYGVIGQTKHPTVQRAIDQVIEKTRAAGKNVGTVCKDSTGARELVKRGVNYLSLDSDQGLLAQIAARYVSDFATALGRADG
jgi:4-hydroxy-2-oxoheptanedioate aldolase